MKQYITVKGSKFRNPEWDRAHKPRSHKEAARRSIERWELFAAASASAFREAREFGIVIEGTSACPMCIYRKQLHGGYRQCPGILDWEPCPYDKVCEDEYLKVDFVRYEQSNSRRGIKALINALKKASKGV